LNLSHPRCSKHLVGRKPMPRQSIRVSISSRACWRSRRGFAACCWAMGTQRMRDARNDLPDVRDGLTRRERIVLWCLSELQKERENRHVPTAMLYGSVVEY